MIIIKIIFLCRFGFLEAFLYDHDQTITANVAAPYAKLINEMSVVCDDGGNMNLK